MAKNKINVVFKKIGLAYYIQSLVLQGLLNGALLFLVLAMIVLPLN
jgi:hypothetical protein